MISIFNVRNNTCIILLQTYFLVKALTTGNDTVFIREKPPAENQSVMKAFRRYCAGKSWNQLIKKLSMLLAIVFNQKNFSSCTLS